jgi:hypothetical protein
MRESNQESAGRLRAVWQYSTPGETLWECVGGGWWQGVLFETCGAPFQQDRMPAMTLREMKALEDQLRRGNYLDFF